METKNPLRAFVRYGGYMVSGYEEMFIFFSSRGSQSTQSALLCVSMSLGLFNGEIREQLS